MMRCGRVDNSPFHRVAHSTHNRVGTFSIVKVQTKQSKWVLFRLSNGYFFS